MIGGLWNGISGLNGFEKALNVESNNISNVSTVGYKEDVISFEDMMYQNRFGKGSSVQNVSKAMSQQGGIKLTNGEYDVAIEGKGYFIVGNTTPNGTLETYYTRAGNFARSEAGFLQTQNGMDVLGLVSKIENTDTTNPDVNSFSERYSSFIASQVLGNNDYVQTINAKATDYKSSAYDDSISYSGKGYKTKSSKIDDIDALISDYKNKLDIYSNYKTFSLDLSTVKLNDEFKIKVNGKEITQSFTSSTPLNDENSINSFLNSKVQELSQKLANATNSTITQTDENEIIISTENKSLTLENALINETEVKISNTTDVEISSKQSTNIDISSYLSQLKKESDNIRVNIDGNQIFQSFISTNATSELKQELYDKDQLLPVADRIGYSDPNGTLTAEQIEMYNVAASQIATLNSFSDKISNIKALTSSINIDSGILNIESLIPGEEVIIDQVYVNNQLLDEDNISTTDAKLGFGISMVNSSKDALKEALDKAGADFLEMTNTVSLDNEKAKQFKLENLNSIQLNLSKLNISDNGLANVEISDGIIYMKDGQNKFIVGKLQTAGFVNEQGLNPAGNNLYQITKAAGEISNAVNLNKLVGTSLEQSKANLGNSLTALLIYQKAFEANSKSITTSDDMLQTAIQLKK